MSTAEHPTDLGCLEELTVKELKALAKTEGIDLGTARLKDSIVDTIWDALTAVPGKVAITPDKDEDIPAAELLQDAVQDRLDRAADIEEPLDTLIMGKTEIKSMETVLRSGGDLDLEEYNLDAFAPAEVALLNKRANAGFHLHSGIFFKRLDDGSVRISCNPVAAGYPASLRAVFSFDVDPESWASVLTALSSIESSAELHQAARDLHG